jgi:hypothetical protein
MPSTSGPNRPARTLLEQLIHERNQTLEEFAAYAETFAQENGEPGTLSAGHLQRLVAGRRYDGRPLGRVRPSTARLLEHIFDTSISQLLSEPHTEQKGASVAELRERIHASARVDRTVISLLYKQLDAIRRLDRQLGSVVACDEVLTKIAQVAELLNHSLSPVTRHHLAALLAELHMLAGWQALDIRNVRESWQHYTQAQAYAAETNMEQFSVHTEAQRAFVLIDIDQPAEAVDLLAEARRRAKKSSPAHLQSWLAAAHGEALAANGMILDSLRAFDDAADLLQFESSSGDGPYVALDSVHLARWRGHALAKLGNPDAVPVLSCALNQLDASFTRAETALRVDLALALSNADEHHEARRHILEATRLTDTVGSARQRRRIRSAEWRLS